MSVAKRLEIASVTQAGDIAKESVDIVVDEHFILEVNGRFLTSFVATPSNIREMIIGHMLDQGYVQSPEEIVNFRIGVEKIFVETKKLHSQSRTEPEFWKTLPSGYTIKSDLKASPEILRRIVKRLNIESDRFREVGGSHTAAIFSGQELLAFADDVGKHNAVDKVVGIAALNKADFSKTILATSGRQPATMIAKAARVGIPISVSLTGAVHSGVALARHVNLTLICMRRGAGMKIYAGPERIVSEPT